MCYESYFRYEFKIPSFIFTGIYEIRLIIFNDSIWSSVWVCLSPMDLLSLGVAHFSQHDILILQIQIVFGLCREDVEEFSHESRLVRFLSERYARAGRVARPLRNSSHTLRVEFALVLIQILDFDETNQVLTTNVWKRYVSSPFITVPSVR